MARRVEDLALLLPIIAGPDGTDPHVQPVALGDPGAVVVADMRVVFFTDNGVRTPTPATIETVRAAARALERAGARVEERVPPDQAEAADLWQRMIDADGKAWLTRLMARAGTTGRGSFVGRPDWPADLAPLDGDALSDLVERVDALRSRLLEWIREIDLIVCPVMPQPAIHHGDSDAPWFGDTYGEVHNLTGWPAAAVRGGTSPEGLPIGVQFVAPPWREDSALAGAACVEAASGGWQRPPL